MCTPQTFSATNETSWFGFGKGRHFILKLIMNVDHFLNGKIHRMQLALN